MVTKEILQALIDGKRIRKKTWKQAYLCLNKDGILVDNKGRENKLTSEFGNEYIILDDSDMNYSIIEKRNALVKILDSFEWAVKDIKGKLKEL